MKKMSKENAIEAIVDYTVDYKHMTDSFYDDGNFVIHVSLLKDNPKEVAPLIYNDLMDDKKFLKYLNSLDMIVILNISSPYTFKSMVYEI